MSQFDANNIYDVVAIDKDGYHEHVVDKYNNVKDLTILKIQFNTYNTSISLLSVDIIDYITSFETERVYYLLSNDAIKISDINVFMPLKSPGIPNADTTRCGISGIQLSSGT
ncbi:MAG: hypothetical protein J6W76_01735, partial [Spirochaetales bacterium]|nr:hypothetical protein [Spirochaetales bacterium]